MRDTKRSEREDLGAEDLIRGIDHMMTTFQDIAVNQRNREIKPGNSESDIRKQFSVGEIVLRKLLPFERSNKLDDKWSGHLRLLSHLTMIVVK